MLHCAAMASPSLLQPPHTDPLHLYRYRDGLYAVDLLTAAVVDLNLLTWLGRHPSDIETICRHFDLAARPADVLMTLLSANGLVEHRGGLYEVTPLAAEQLCDGSPFNLAPYYASLRERPVVKDFLRVLRSGKPAHWGGETDGKDWHRAMEDETFARTFTAAMDCRGHYLAQALNQKLDFTGRRRLLDVGGGSGIYASVLTAHHPEISAVVFDQPPVDRIARSLVTERGCADRVAVIAGNFFDDAWPAGCDVHLFSNVLHDWDSPDVARLLAKSFESMPSGGLLVIHDAFINATKTGPRPVAEYSALLMHSTQGKCYSTREYESMLDEAGFRRPAFTETAADRGVMTAHKP